MDEEDDEEEEEKVRRSFVVLLLQISSHMFNSLFFSCVNFFHHPLLVTKLCVEFPDLGWLELDKHERTVGNSRIDHLKVNNLKVDN